MPDDHSQAFAGGALLRERLAPAIKSFGSQAAFAARAGIPKDTLSKYFSGTQPGASALVKMADTAGLSLDFLLGRSAHQAVSGVSAELIANVNGMKARGRSDRETRLPDGFVAIPQLQVRASAGPGRATLPVEFDPEPQLAFREGWLRSLGVAPRNAEFLLAHGDSMQPTICDGDLMLVDRGFGKVLNGKIYVLVVNGLVIVKRVQLLAVGGLMLISDNDRYPTETIPAADVPDLSVEARVAWYGRAI